MMPGFFLINNGIALCSTLKKIVLSQYYINCEYIACMCLGGNVFFLRRACILIVSSGVFVYQITQSNTNEQQTMGKYRQYRIMKPG